MTASQYCASNGKEGKTGRIMFSKKKIKDFIDTYTDHDSDDFTNQQLEMVKIAVMIDLYEMDYRSGDPGLVDRVVLPEFILKLIRP